MCNTLSHTLTYLNLGACAEGVITVLVLCVYVSTMSLHTAKGIHTTMYVVVDVQRGLPICNAYIIVMLYQGFALQCFHYWCSVQFHVQVILA